MKKLFLILGLFLIMISVGYAQNGLHGIIKTGYGQSLSGLGVGGEIKASNFASGFGIGVLPSMESMGVETESKLGVSIYTKIYANPSLFKGFWGEFGFSMMGVYEENTETKSIYGPYLMGGYTFQLNRILAELGLGYGYGIYTTGDTEISNLDSPYDQLRQGVTLQLSIGYILF